VLACGVLNAILYSGLLPLWEGFDEPFHYAYVQQISTELKLPVLGRATLSREVWVSLHLAPVSRVVQHNLPALRAYDQYLALPLVERNELRRQLEHIPAEWKYANHDTQLNYEAQQAPLAYLLLAFPDRLLSDVPLPRRIFLLRLACAVTATLLTFVGSIALAKQVGLRGSYSCAVLWCVFSSQMFWATVAHVSNDWLAVPLAVWMLAAAAHLLRGPCSKRAYVFMVFLALGLLTKAYFLAFVVPAIALVAVLGWRKQLRLTTLAGALLLVLSVSGTWYARNALLYHSAAGTLQSVSGVGPGQVLSAVGSVPWRHSIPLMARASLWTGNNSFLTFSRTTLDVVLVLLLVSACLYSIHTRCKDLLRGEGVLLTGCLVFSLAIAYATTADFVYLKHLAVAAAPWYAQILLVPVLTLIFSGLQRSATIGRVLSAVTTLLWGYILVATYVVKLIPLYAGYGGPRANLGGVLAWYLGHSADAVSNLGTLALTPPAVLLALVAVTLVLLTLAGVGLVRSLLRSSDSTAAV